MIKTEDRPAAEARTSTVLRRQALNVLAAFLAGDGALVLLAPRSQTLLWSPRWSPTPWREPLRFLAGRPALTRLLALGELILGLTLACASNRRVDKPEP